MATKRALFGLWFPVGVGIFVCGAALRWPNHSAYLIAVGGGIITFTLVFHWCRTFVSIFAGVIVTLIIFSGFWVADLYWPSSNLPAVGPRLEFQGIHVDVNGDTDHLVVHLVNTSDFPAAAVSAAASIFVSSQPNANGNPDVAKAVSVVSDTIRKPTLTAGHGMQITRGMGIELALDRPHSDRALIEAGNKYLYIIVMSKSLDVRLPGDYAWIAETCALITGAIFGLPIMSRLQ